jgi:hypothetical protein
MTPRPIVRGDLHARLPLAGHEALVAYAEREGISLNTALWLLVRRGLEHEGIRVEVGGRRSEEVAPVARVPSVAAAAVEVDELVELAHHGEVGRRLPAVSGPSSSTPPPGPGRRRRRRR